MRVTTEGGAAGPPSLRTAGAGVLASPRTHTLEKGKPLSAGRTGGGRRGAWIPRGADPTKTSPAGTRDRDLPRRRARGGAARSASSAREGGSRRRGGRHRTPVPSPAAAHQLPVRFLSTVPWAQRLRTCCTDRLIMEWSPASAFIFPGGRPPPSPRAPGGGGGGEAPGAAAGARLLQAAAAGQGCGAPGRALLLLLRPTDLRGGPLSASPPRQPPPRRGDIEDGGRGRGGGPALSPRGPPARTRCGGGRRRSLSGAAPRRGDRARWEAEVEPGGGE